MNLLFGERATAELVGKLRLLTACELCKKPCNETFYAVECGHYICKDCVPPPANKCAKCSVPGMILRAHYLDPISETLLKLKDFLCGEQPPKLVSNKRKADPDLTTPTSKAIKNSAKATKNSDNLGTPPIDAVFGRKSKPAGPGTPVTSRVPENRTNLTIPASAVIPTSAEEVFLGNVSLSRSIRDSPVIASVKDQKQCCCSCGKADSAPVRKSFDLGVQVSNSVLTLDVSVHAKPSMTDAQIQTDESMSGLIKPALHSTGVQTERPHVSVKRYFEIAVQTDEQMDKMCRDFGSDAKSLTSTQAVGVNQTVHAQPISLDMSPIKRMDRTGASEETILKRANRTSEDTMDLSGDYLNQEAGLNTNTDFTSASKKDTLDSLDYRTLDLKEAGDQSRRKEASASKPASPEPDSLDSLPSELFNNLDKTQKKTSSKKIETQPEQRDTLDTFFRSSEEASIPETEPASRFASPVKASKTKRATGGSEPDSPLRLTEKKKKTVIVSDEDEPPVKTRYDGTDHRHRSLKTKTATKVKENKMSKKSQPHIAKALPTFSSDEDDADPLPMDTEDMRNLEKEIENLDREMEDSKTCGKSRF